MECRSVARLIRDATERTVGKDVFATDFPVPNQGAPIRVEAKFVNGGATPAYHVQFESFVAVLPAGLTGPLTGFSERLHTPGISTAQKSTMYKDDPLYVSVQTNRNLTKTEIDAIMDGSESKVYSWGQINFLDYAGNAYFTHYCYIFGGPDLLEGYSRDDLKQHLGCPFNRS